MEFSYTKTYSNSSDELIQTNPSLLLHNHWTKLKQNHSTVVVLNANLVRALYSKSWHSKF